MNSFRTLCVCGVLDIGELAIYGHQLHPQADLFFIAINVTARVGLLPSGNAPPDGRNTFLITSGIQKFRIQFIQCNFGSSGDVFEQSNLPPYSLGLFMKSWGKLTNFSELVFNIQSMKQPSKFFHLCQRQFLPNFFLKKVEQQKIIFLDFTHKFPIKLVKHNIILDAPAKYGLGIKIILLNQHEKDPGLSI